MSSQGSLLFAIEYVFGSQPSSLTTTTEKSPPIENHHHHRNSIVMSCKEEHMVWRDPSLVSNPGNSPCCSSFWWSGAFNINQFLVKPDSAGGKSALQLQEHLRPTLGGWLGHDGGHWTNAWTAQKKMRSRVDSSKCQSCEIFMAKLFLVFSYSSRVHLFLS